jgi:hypothetical protein
LKNYIEKLTNFEFLSSSILAWLEKRKNLMFEFQRERITDISSHKIAEKMSKIDKQNTGLVGTIFHFVISNFIEEFTTFIDSCIKKECKDDQVLFWCIKKIMYGDVRMSPTAAQTFKSVSFEHEEAMIKSTKKVKKMIKTNEITQLLQLRGDSQKAKKSVWRNKKIKKSKNVREKNNRKQIKLNTASRERQNAKKAKNRIKLRKHLNSSESGSDKENVPPVGRSRSKSSKRRLSRARSKRRKSKSRNKKKAERMALENKMSPRKACNVSKMD